MRAYFPVLSRLERGRYLKEAGTMLPRRGFVHLAGFKALPKDNEEDLLSTTKETDPTVDIEIASPELIITKDAKILDADLNSCNWDSRQFKSHFELVAKEDARVRGFVA